ncbi:hypothetical protein H5V45_01935 [Nocardioides sp. KIGAM211]|uniref:Uncharacterized protein n=1 Tax=Nocardioides luti TaxID=2761101 RepID=A0A7X0V9A9_9ACTN|nr:hypothetical protein [Nocardioides luti]MBB6626070.1 hypothetical protein [Nocardioides luti]
MWTALTTGGGAWITIKGSGHVLRAIDCSRFSEQRNTSACQSRGDTTVGIFVVAAVVLLVIGYAAWRWWMRKVERAGRDRKDPET